ncbi:unnamed protein product [Rhizoctonia solani]|uniref:Uncharacterized protein n=1 Tax=Rhizoctonia solani TaxID=456999 RepID=A0A8H3I035_9AGAM|nr:unnamed protein product [Rhizoctonia solani]
MAMFRPNYKDLTYEANSAAGQGLMAPPRRSQVPTTTRSFPSTMELELASLSDRHQTLTLSGCRLKQCYLRTSDSSINYESRSITEVLRNDKHVATVHWGWLRRAGITMSRDNQSGAPNQPETTPRISWGLFIGQNLPTIVWLGFEYLHAYHVKDDRVAAVYDPREGVLELKYSLRAESQVDMDVVDEIVAVWVVHEWRIAPYRVQPEGRWPWVDAEGQTGIPEPKEAVRFLLMMISYFFVLLAIALLYLFICHL